MKPAIAFPIRARSLPGPALLVAQTGTVPAEAIRQQLSRILLSEGFARAPRMKRFLEFIVGETLAGRSSQLCEYGIATLVFERPPSFEPGLDPIVRNDARRLRNKLLEYYQRKRDTQHDQVVIDVPKGGYVPSFRPVAAVPAKRSGAQYRLCVSIIRVTDGSEVLSEAFDFEGEHCSVQFEVKTA